MTNIYTVRELTERLKQVVEVEFPFVWVRGQVSNLVQPASGHIYFSLKDEDAILSVVWFRSIQQQRVTRERVDLLTGEIFGGNFRHSSGSGFGGYSGLFASLLPGPDSDVILANGQEVIISGRLTVYPPRGSCQLVAESIEDVGLGRMHLELEAQKRRYAALGYFDQERKRSLPVSPIQVAVVTAATGAAWQDFIRIAGERGAGAAIRLYPTPVQGESAPASIVQAMADAVTEGFGQVLVLIRGGGSLEDLWAFNTALVVEAVFRSPLPVLAGIGHEVDVSISDMVADVRAATPSHAAQLLWPERNMLVQRLDTLEIELDRVFGQYGKIRQEQLAALARVLIWLSPAQSLERMIERLEVADKRLEMVWCRRLEWHKVGLIAVVSRLTAAAYGPSRLGSLSARLASLTGRLTVAGEAGLTRCAVTIEGLAARLIGLDPCAPLARGYSLIWHVNKGCFLRSAQDAAPGDYVDIELADGRLGALVKSIFPIPSSHS
ncbi:Exodeoxyribonuclease 7 large subunit [Desulfovibrionales bacterium]